MKEFALITVWIIVLFSMAIEICMANYVVGIALLIAFIMQSYAIIKALK
jgi:hypothetical protein